MGTSATQVAQVRAEIDRSRRELFATVDVFEERLRERKEEVVDRVSPPRVWQRKTAGLRRRWDDVRTSIDDMTTSVTSSGMTARREIPMAGSGRRVKGQAEELSERAGAAVSSAGDQTRRAAPALRERTERNPMVAGLVAVGAGFLAAALLPPTEREREAAQRLRQEIEPLKRQASTAGREVAGELKQVAEGSVEQLKERASGAVDQVKQETQSSARQVKDEAEDAGTTVKRRAASASRKVKQTSTNGESVSGPAPRQPRRSPRRAPIKARSTS